eukprot:Gregarina_sp_Poly_1__7122@NODE_38_length_18185_cov_164_455735_g33_i0_p9_GENE_NODE_38_length_18185_cov_164_455735_g33_i0NODE_38_length_18185_cov_164_455735_g33_i0_p9_ORF_typecomplete_len178_score26_72_NODE_38_length_18185_cov_164_455735_g33_i080888621
MTGWQKLQEAEDEAPVSLNAVDRLTSKINEAVANRITRCLQIYYLVRLRKILQDPVSVIGLQEANPGANLIEQRELTLAKKWNDYILDHELDYTSASYTCAHVMAKAEVLNSETKAVDVLKKYAAYGTSEEDRANDEMLEFILAALQTEATGSNPVMCLMCDRFRRGFYSAKLDARL